MSSHRSKVGQAKPRGAYTRYTTMPYVPVKYAERDVVEPWLFATVISKSPAADTRPDTCMKSSELLPSWSNWGCTNTMSPTAGVQLTMLAMSAPEKVSLFRSPAASVVELVHLLDRSTAPANTARNGDPPPICTDPAVPVDEDPGSK